MIVDSREQAPLEFKIEGLEVVREGLKVGDYGFIDNKGVRDNAVIERKSIGDLFGSYGGKGYERERNKIIKAKDMGLRFILAIEASIWDVRSGHEYWDGGRVRTSGKTGLSMVRQLMSVARKYEVDVWFCGNREKMAFMVYEYFLAGERLRAKEKKVGG